MRQVELGGENFANDWHPGIMTSLRTCAEGGAALATGDVAYPKRPVGHKAPEIAVSGLDATAAVLAAGKPGHEGIAPSREGMEWLASHMAMLLEDIPDASPRLYPDEDGNIAMEWSIGDGRTSLDVDLTNRAGYRHWWNAATAEDGESEHGLNRPAQWEAINRKLAAHTAGGG